MLKREGGKEFYRFGEYLLDARDIIIDSCDAISIRTIKEST